MNRTYHDRNGFALPVAMFALVVAGVIATAGFFMARQEMRIGLASENAALASYLTEWGAAQLVEDWDATVFGSLANWADTTVTVSYADLGTVSATVTKMTSRLYYAELQSSITRGGELLSGASRSTGYVLRMASAELDPPAALTTRGAVAIKGTAEVHGEDMYPPDWTGICTNPLEDKPGIMNNDTTLVSGGGGGGGKGGGGSSSLTGNPAMVEDTTIADSTFTNFGELTWNDLIGLADVTLTGGSINGTAPDSTAGGDCITSTSTNWGNPENPTAACGDYFPIIYISADATIQSAGVGQGILLVDGDLDLRGTFIFHGVIITQGYFETQGSGHRILGGVMASNANLETQSLVGGSVVQNSTCAVERAILLNSGLTRVRPLAERSFVDVTAIQNY